MNLPENNSSHWFTETCKAGGCAFSLKIDKQLHQEQTKFQYIEIYSTEQFGNLMVIDGFVMLTGRDNFLYHEMMSHPALFTHPKPVQVVIIGGGDCGTLREVLKHSDVEQVLQVEIDERVTQLSEQYFPELCISNRDSRVDFLFADGTQWIEDATSNSVDVIIIDSTDPIGPAVDLFSESFYRNCYRVLGDAGLLVHQSESPLLHYESIIQPMHKRMYKAKFSSVGTLSFPQPCYPSGWWSATIAGKLDVRKFREEDVQNKTFTTSYYNRDIHRGALAQPEFF